MTPQIECRIPLFLPDALVGRDSGYLKGVFPLADGSVVAAYSRHSEGTFQDFLTHAGQGFRRELPVPPMVRERVDACIADPVTKNAGYGAPIAFQVGERIGLLVTDRHAWVFDPGSDGAPLEIAIEALPLAKCINAPRSFIPVRAGVGVDGLVPVTFLHPDGRDDYPSYLSTLELDFRRGTGRWSLRSPDVRPVTVPYRVDPGGHNGVDEYAGTSLGDAAWLGDRFRLFTMGNQPHYGRMGMLHAAAIEADAAGSNPHCLREMDESSHGIFAADGRHMLLLPFFKSGARKGKPALLDLDTGGEHGLAVRGLASYRPLAYRDGVVWFAGKGSWANWASLVLDADTPGELVACRMV